MLDRCVFLFTKTLVRPPGTVVPGGRIFYCWCFFCLLLGFAGLYHIRAASADSRETLNMTGSVWTQATSVPKLGGGRSPNIFGATAFEPDSAAKHLQQNSWQTFINMWTCTSSARIGTCTRSTPSGRQHPSRSPTWRQAGMEAITRPSSTNLDPPAGGRRRAHCRCCLGHGQWSWSLECATTRRRSSCPQSTEWVLFALRPHISELPRPIAVKLCQMTENRHSLKS